jgi:hypothetical protein
LRCSLSAGLNLANNNIHRDSVLVLVEELLGNTVMQALLLKNNPGLDRHIANVMLAAIRRNTLDTTSSSTQDVVEHLEIRHSSGARRLELQSPRIALLLRTWQQLEVEESFAPQMPVLPSKHFGGGSTTSAATLGSTAKTAAKGSSKKMGATKEKAATPGTRRAAEAELVAQLSRPQGYSAFDLVTDRVSSAPNSPRRGGSPSARQQADRSFASFLSDSFASAGNGTSRHDTFNLPSLRREESDAKTDQFNVADFYQPSFQERTSARQATRADSIGDSIQLSVDSLDGADSQQNTPRVGEDVLDNAIPVVSPVKNEAENVLRAQSSAYYIGMDRSAHSDSKALAKDSQRGANAEGVEDWGNVDWPVSDDVADQEESGGRPPSRISIRRRGSGSTGARTPSPTQDMDAQHRALDEQYRRLLQQVKSSSRPPRHDSQGRMSVSSQDLSRSSAPLRASFSGQPSSRSFPSNRPFYAGGSIPGASPPRPVPSTITNEEMAALFGPGRGIARPASAPTYSTTRTARPSTHPVGVRQARKGAKTGKKQKSAAVKRTVLGKAQGPRGTRIRARSADQLEAQARSSGGEGRRAAPSSTSKRSPSSGADLAHELSSTVLNATRNLETVSAKLRDVIDTLSTSMDMNITMQRELLSASMLNTTAGGANTSRAAWASPSTIGATTPLSYMKHPAHGADSAAPSSANRSAAAHRYREQSASPAPYSSHSGDFPVRGNGHSALHDDPRADHGAHEEDAPVGEADPELVDMVRARLGMKLRSMLVA